MGRKKKHQSHSEQIAERPASAASQSSKERSKTQSFSENNLDNEDIKHSPSDVVTDELKPEGRDPSEEVDILGNGLIVKKVLSKGLGRESRPNHGDLVEISFKGYLEDGTVVDDVESMECTLGDGDIVQALDLALPLAERNERFEVITDARFAYGSRGRDPDVPGDAKIRYVVHLASSSEPPSFDSLTDDKRLLIANQKRERGNYYYGREEYAFAVNSYNKALKVLSAPLTTPPPSTSGEPVEDFTELLEELEIKLLNNLAASQLKIQAYDAAIKSCNAVLDRDSANYKALFRKGKALLERGDLDEAVPILRLVHTMVPTSNMVASELSRARMMLQRERERWSRATNKMFPRQSKTASGASLQATGRSSRRWWIILLSSALLTVLASIAVAWYFEQIPSFH